MSEQPKPDTCECGNDMGHIAPGRRWEIGAAPGREFCSAQCARWAVALDAERARADAAERRTNAYKRVLNEFAKEVMPHAGADHRETAELHAVTGAAHPNHAEQSAHWRGCEHAHHGCALALLEDWQECAGHLALVLRSLPEDPFNYERDEALAEFDRLAGEATKGVEF